MGGGVRFSGAWVRTDVFSSPELVVSPGIGEFERLMDFFFRSGIGRVSNPGSELRLFTVQENTEAIQAEEPRVWERMHPADL